MNNPVIDLATHLESLLTLVEKPARYLGGELGAIYKDDSKVSLYVCLAFPDLYEVGMSHLGLQLLYELINLNPRMWAERAFLPQSDMEALLRREKLPLFSLETKRALSDFDVVGFSLQYELCATGVVAMLDLGRIPIFSKERSKSNPLVIAGGPLAYQPEPFADFIDAFLIGDAEELLPEFLEVVQKAKAQGNEREDLLKEAAKLSGVYVPSFHKPHLTDNRSEIIHKDKASLPIKRRVLSSLAGAVFPRRPIVPNMQVVHDRLSVEIMRGCLRGCRFCQAGYIYRPQRERPVNEVVKLAEEGLSSSGYEEISLLSLSSADYSGILPLLKRLKKGCAATQDVTISFPSIRVDALREDLLNCAKTAKRAGFTIAPEAGTQRLRNVINKGLSEEQILGGCRRIFEMGWSRLKLYFMIGLPTETDEDLAGIVDLIVKIRSLSGPRRDLSCTISTFVPKPHTPFQWCEQIGEEEIVRRQQLLLGELKNLRVKLRFHDPFSTVIEGVLARGDRRASAVIKRAFELGCRLDAWPDKLQPELWRQAMSEAGLCPHAALKARPLESKLPWEHISTGISKDFLLNEWQRAQTEVTTKDCISGPCSGCQVCVPGALTNLRSPADPTPPAPQLETLQHNAVLLSQQPTPLQNLRLRYQKKGLARFHAHLDLAKIFFRAAKRARLPIAYSNGFNPQPRFSFGPPLQLGIESSFEFVDIALVKALNPKSVLEALNPELPDGICVLEAEELTPGSASIQASLKDQSYEAVLLPQHQTKHALIVTPPQDTSWRTKRILRVRKNKTSEMLWEEALSDFSMKPQRLQFSVRCSPDQPALKPFEVISAATGLDPALFNIHKSNVSWRT
ncbi:MAG: TIGR03960 family B12-binding radical SAM protein [Deltaproteobacteria bacterium]|nr:TIGR03960 family B12-binding radical SAM protein [Deltaproteobacteria bacterium]